MLLLFLLSSVCSSGTQSPAEVQSTDPTGSEHHQPHCTCVSSQNLSCRDLQITHFHLNIHKHINTITKT